MDIEAFKRRWGYGKSRNHVTLPDDPISDMNFAIYWLDTYQTALRNIFNVLGPNILDCKEQHCDGCRAEAYEALRLTKDALNIEDGGL